MKKLSIFACIICMLVLASCNFINKPQMVVYYDDFYSESPIATEPDTMKSYLDKDSIVKNKVPLSDWEYINSHILETHKHKNSIPEPHMVVKTDSLLFFVGGREEAYNENYDSIAITPKAIYLILKYSNYFNKITREDLQYHPLILKFGIPKEHCFEYKELNFLEWKKRIERMVTYHLQPEN